jgi:hypothetical protein
MVRTEKHDKGRDVFGHEPVLETLRCGFFVE